MTITTDGIIAACTGLLAVFAVLGLAVRLVLLPYLRTHLVQPVAEVRAQVKNTHETNLREDIDDLATKLDRIARSHEQGRREDAHRWREHLTYSATIADRIERLEQRGKRPEAGK